MSGPRVDFRRPAGMPCPDCRTAIVIDPLQLLAGAPILCAGCGLELRVDRDKSAVALDALGTYLSELQEIAARAQPREPGRRRRGRSAPRPERRSRAAARGPR